MKTQKEIEKLAEERFWKWSGRDFEEYEITQIEKGEYISGYLGGYTQCQKDMADTQKVTRFEVIDKNGRAYTQRDCKVELSYQDDDRTLKVFIKSNKQD